VPAVKKSRRQKTSNHLKEKDTLAAHSNDSDGVNNDDDDVHARELERSAAPVGEPFHTLVLYELPSVLDEPLTAADLREFLAYLAERRGLPDKLLTPPVISRIVNSRACRGAVKFGDALSRSSCDDILQKLAVTELPFQCAHGRPSMAPLLDLRGPQTRKRWQLLQEHAVRTGNCSKELAL
jgi:DNA mismatch repair ATPase MutL